MLIDYGGPSCNPFLMKKVLLISGSLRKESFNTYLLKEVMGILSGKLECEILSYDDIPYMNQDIEFNDLPSIKRVREKVKSADALWISTPEYNHSYSGVLKNLIDWLSRPTVPGDYNSPVIKGKVVALSAVAGSSAGSFALEKLRELMEMCSCDVCEKITGVALGARFGKVGLVLSDEEMSSLKDECASLLESFSL